MPGRSTYALNTGCYGLKIKPLEFQKIKDRILHTTKNTFTFTDDILIVIIGMKEEHMTQVDAVVKVIDEAGVRLKLEKCQIAKRDTERLGNTLSAEGIKPIKVQVRP